MPKQVDTGRPVRDTPIEQHNVLLWGSLSKGGCQPPPPKTEALTGTGVTPAIRQPLPCRHR